MVRFLIILIAVFWSAFCFADVETTSVLPLGVYSPKFIFGVSSGLDERYNSVGLIEGVADQYHFDLTGTSLSKLDPQLGQLVQVLNNFAPGERLGDELTLGTLDFKAVPSVTYFAPTISYGLTKDFSIGFGLPFIHFHNSMSVVSSGGNVAQLRNYIQGANPTVTSAMDQLVTAAQNMTAALNGILRARGYQPIRDVDFSAPGDLTISGIYRYYTSKFWKLALRPFIQVPTGRKDDPDDLVDIATGGQPALGLYTIHDLVFSRAFSLVSSLGYQANIQDTADMRVPNGPDDILPGPDRKETVRRKTGNSIFAETGFAWSPFRTLEIRGLYDFAQKDPDWYDGDRGWDYSVLSLDTGTQTHTVHGILEFSSVDLFKRKIFAVPFMLGYVYGNTIYAVNAPDQISHQVYLRMFF